MTRRSSLLTGVGLAIGYEGRKPLVSQLDVALLAGEMTCLIGPNGAGKSTLLKTLVGSHRALQGLIEVEGTSLRELSARQTARRIGLVLPQRVGVGLLRVEELVALGRHPHTGWTGRLNRSDRAVVSTAISAVGLDCKRNEKAANLSDGEFQRAMIARALAQEARVLVLDEPTAFLDLPGRVEILALLGTLAHSGHAVLLSTHDLDLALRTSDRLWIMNGRGAFREGSPEDLVLEGAVGAAFSRSGLIYDVEESGFRRSRETIAPVKVIGEGTRAVWTRRALERRGYSVDAESDLVVEVESGQWTLTAVEKNEPPLVVSSIEDLLSELSFTRSLQPSRRDGEKDLVRGSGDEID